MSAENEQHGPSFEVPKAPAEQIGQQEKRRQAGLEQAGPARESAPRAPAQIVSPPVTPLATSLPATEPPAAAEPPQPASPSPKTDDLQAKDADLIEKQWVAKAKQIVSETRDDPHAQKNQISRVKADYIAKRFNKAIKVDDATA